MNSNSRKGVIAKTIAKHLISTLIILLFLAGIIIFSFPYVSDFFHSRAQTRVIETYHDVISNTDESHIDEIIKVAREYNEELRNNPNRFHLTENELAQYHTMLRTDNEIEECVIGSLEIDKIGIKLPIYRGTDDAILQIGAGHIEGTSLPVGGPGTHTVITGHRGLHTAKLMTDIDRMKIGDVFTLNILGLRLHYITDQIEVVLPDDYSKVAICPNSDYATLLTCTPIGVNTHRLLIRGVRVPDEDLTDINNKTEDYQIKVWYFIIIALLFSSFLLLLILLFLIIRKKVKEKRC